MKHIFPSVLSLLGGETLGIEYKRDIDPKNKRGPASVDTIAESLMAIGNRDGGYLLLGVENGGAPVGINRSRAESVAALRNAVARKFTVPPPLDAVEEQASGRRVFMFYVEPAKQYPYQLQDGTLKIRKDLGNKQGPENVAFPLSELPQWQAQRGVHYDLSSYLFTDMPWSDYERFLNPLALDMLQRRIADGNTDPVLRSMDSLEQQMDTLGVVGTVDGRRVLKYAAVVLFGRNDVLRDRVPAHAAQFQVFASDGSLPINRFTGDAGMPYSCLLYLAERIEELLRGVVPRKEMMDGMFRIDIPAYGDDALREAVMNAFIHRDYTIPEPVIIQVMPDQFTITNPGGFYRDVSAANILFHEPCPRNQCLAQACVLLHLMERSGRGVDRIFWDQIRFLRPMPSYADSTAEAVRLTLLGGEGSLEAVRWMLDYFSGKDLRVRVVHGGLIHVLLNEGEATREELIESLPGLPDLPGRRAITDLINAGLVSRIGHGRGQRLVLSPQFLRDLGMPEAFVHQVGLDRERQRQMILKYVETHGYIRRGNAARLLGMKADNAVYRLLDDLVQDGSLVREGERSKARYRLP